MKMKKTKKWIVTLMIAFAMAFVLALPASAEQTPLMPAAYQIYFSGIDNRGPLIAESRSDANVIITVNTETKQILLVHIPRDYFIEFASDPGFKDKLTNCGLKGISNVVASVNRFLDQRIEFYVRIGFQGVIDFIDANGGITVNSAYEFNTGKYHFAEGANTLDGAAALAFARERQSFDTGDRQRGQNQMALMSAIVESFSQGDALSNLQAFLTAMEGNYETNVPAQYILTLGASQVLDQSAWNIVTYSLNGTDSSFEGEYVMEPDMETVETAKTLMQRVMDGEMLDQADAPATSTVSNVIDLTDKELIRKTQEALNAAGYDCGEADGVIGAKTSQAIQDYEADHDLTPYSGMNRELLHSLGVI